jgi:acetyl-CoA acetyltransferase
MPSASRSTPSGWRSDDAGLRREDLDGLLVNPGFSGATWAWDRSSSSRRSGCAILKLTADHEPRRCDGERHDRACGAGHRRWHLPSRRVRVLGCAAQAAVAQERHGGGTGAAYRFARGLDAAYGFFGVNAMYALVAKRHMHRYGTTQDHLGRVAVAQRRWANLNPAAQLHDKPLTLDEYHRSRWIVEPFHLFDCCLVSNGGLAVIVTSSERARAARKPPVYIWGMGQGHLGGDPADTLTSGAVLAKETAFPMAEVGVGDFDVVELYDCYTFTVLVTLEDYGFCPKGEGGRFVVERVGGPGAGLAVNTGGGQLSSFYMWGMTPVSEAIIQLRGEGGARQVAKHDLALVSGNGGVLSTHSTLVLSRLPS